MQNIIFEPQTATVRFERDGHAIEAEAALPGGGAAEMAHWLVSQIDISEYENEFSSLGRHPFDPRLMIAIFIYANCIGKRSTREIEKMCKEGIGAIWLLGGASPPSHSTCSRHRSAMARCCGAESAAAQIAQLLAEAGEISFEAFFQDGTKIESFAGRYTFAWRGSVEKWLAKALAKAPEALSEACALLGIQQAGAEPATEQAPQLL